MRRAQIVVKLCKLDVFLCIFKMQFLYFKNSFSEQNKYCVKLRLF